MQSWNSSGSGNVWNDNTTVNIYLNKDYLSKLGLGALLISNHTWEVGGMLWSNTFTAKEYFDVEINNLDNNRSVSTMKIGLMYVSDYGFAASPEYWNIPLSNYDEAYNYNWINQNYPGWNGKSSMWTISRNSNDTTSVFDIDLFQNIGSLEYQNSRNNMSMVVYPTFYLKSNLTLSHGTGTKSNPFYLSLD